MATYIQHDWMASKTTELKMFETENREIIYERRIFRSELKMVTDGADKETLLGRLFIEIQVSILSFLI